MHALTFIWRRQRKKNTCVRNEMQRYEPVCRQQKHTTEKDAKWSRQWTNLRKFYTRNVTFRECEYGIRKLRSFFSSFVFFLSTQGMRSRRWLVWRHQNLISSRTQNISIHGLKCDFQYVARTRRRHTVNMFHLWTPHNLSPMSIPRIRIPASNDPGFCVHLYIESNANLLHEWSHDVQIIRSLRNERKKKLNSSRTAASSLNHEWQSIVLISHSIFGCGRCECVFDSKFKQIHEDLGTLRTHVKVQIQPTIFVSTFNSNRIRIFRPSI